jgi:hypothetical protein
LSFETINISIYICSINTLLADGVGTFLSDDTLDGKPIKVRGLFSPLSPTLAQWEQAYSADNGKTWETNWVMRYIRTAAMGA